MYLSARRRPDSPEFGRAGLRMRCGRAEQTPTVVLSRSHPWCFGMTKLPFQRVSPKGGDPLRLLRRILMCALVAGFATVYGAAQTDDQLNKVHVQPPSANNSAPTQEPKGAEAPPESGRAALNVHPGSF